MRMAKVLGFAAVPLLLVGADVLARVQWEESAFQDACYRFVEAEGTPSIPPLPRGLFAVALGQRRAVVNELGARAKAYLGSDAFRREWVRRHGGHEADPQSAKQTAETEASISQSEAQAARSLQDAEQMIAMLPPEMQAKMRADLTKAKADLAKHRAQKATKAARASADNAQVPDAKAALRKALTRFLKVTDNVDFKAVLVHQGHQRLFANPAYEQKPELWKAAFRAGQEGTEAARAYAQAWLAELK